MNTTQVKGATRNVANKAGLAPGALKGNAAGNERHEMRQAGSELEAKLVERLSELREWTVQQPITALVITACITFVLGARWASQWHRDHT